MADYDPEIATFAARLTDAWAQFPNLGARPYPEQRQAAEQVRAPWREGGPVMASTETHHVPGPTRSVTVRIHAPGPGPRPALVYLHGGGFTTFSLDTHDRIMREYASRAGVTVVGVDYALSPEAKFPQALNEVVAVFDWLAVQGDAVGIDPSRLAIGGDSAGANLALSTALTLRDRRDGDRLSALLLAYGFFDDDLTTPSQRAYGQPGALLSRDELAGFLDNYFARPEDRINPLALPALADLHDLPPSFHLIAECDPLADGDRDMAAKLAMAGSHARAVEYRGACHSFLEAVSISTLAEQALQESAAWLKDQLKA